MTAPADPSPSFAAATAPSADTARPPDPGAPQEEVDRHWLDHVHQPNAPQLTARAAVAGMLLGGVMSISNLYIGMKIGWSIGMAITSTILAFATFKMLAAFRLSTRELSPLENNTVASAASAAGYFSSAGMVSAIPALYLTQQRVLSWAELAVWMFGVSIVGVFMAIPMRRQMIDVDRLAFPSGIACAETIRSMHTSAGEAIAKARALLWGAVLAAVVEIPAQFGGIARKGERIWRSPLTWAENIKLPGAIAGKSLISYTLAFPTSTLLYGAGALIGTRVGLSLLLGALVLYAGAVPWLAAQGIIVVAADQPGLTYRSVLAWSVWPGVMAALAASLLQFALKWRTIAQAFGSLGRLAKSGAKPSLMAPVEVPPKWFLWGMLFSTAYIAVAAWVIFQIPPWMSVVAVLLSFVLSIVACRATGETDVTPIGALGKITQLLYAGLYPGHYATNLMTASVTAGSAAHSADLLTDLKTGYLLGGSPKRQFVAQMLGIVAGAAFCVPAYLLVAQPEKIGTSELPAPAAQTWAVVADLLAHGIEQVDRGQGQAESAVLQVVPVTRRPPGTALGDTLVIEDGPNRGEYRITAVMRGNLVVDRDLPVAEVPHHDEPFAAAVRAADRSLRGTTAVKAKLGQRPAVRFTRPVRGLQSGDYVSTTRGGREIFHKVEGLRGDTAALDHPFVVQRGAATVSVAKRTLPPFAGTATLIGILIGLVFTLVDVYAPKGVRQWLPSISALGIAWVINGHDSIAMAVGALVAYVIAKIWQAKSEQLTVAASSGIIAGASLMGLLIILLRDVLKVLLGPE